MPVLLKAKARPATQLLCVFCLFFLAGLSVSPQTTPAPPAQTAPAGPGAFGPIAIVPLNPESSDSAATVTGALEVTGGNALIAANGSITSGSRTTNVALPHRGVLRVCAATTVKLAADSSVPEGETPGLLIAMDHGAIETSFATGRNADILLTPDFRILIGGPGSSELKVRLGRDGDTCVDNSATPGGGSSLGGNAGADAPYVVVTSLFENGLYRVQPGQRVMFQHGSLHEVVDQENEPCGCPPPPAAAAGNEFPLAQSEGLAPLPKPAPAPKQPTSAAPANAPPLVYATPAPQPAATPPAPATPPAVAPAPAAASAPPQAKKKPGIFTRLGHFFRRVFGAE